MKKITSILLLMILILSFSGCLKDDYEALEKDISNIEESIDDKKDLITDLEVELQELIASKELNENELEDLHNQSNDLSNEKSLLNDKIIETSDDGLKITPVEFEFTMAGFKSDLDDYDAMDMFSIPETIILNDKIVLRYYLYINDDLYSNMYYELTLSSDNIHVEEIKLYGDSDIYNNHYDEYINYGTAMVYMYVSAREESYFSIIYDTDLYYDLISQVPMYNNTVQMDVISNSQTIEIIIYDIS